MPEGAVYVGRPTKYGNPIHISKDGLIKDSHGREVRVNGWACMHADPRDAPRKFLAAGFEAWLGLPEQAALREAARKELAGHDLACWCPLTEPCHADVLLKVAA